MGPPAMVLPLAVGETDADVLSDRPQSRSSLAFVIGLVIAALLTISGTIILLAGEGLAGGSNSLVSAMLIASLVLCAALAGILAHRLIHVARAWRASASGARLHIRFVTLFSLAAL